MLEAEAVHFSKKNGGLGGTEAPTAESTISNKRQIEAGPGQDDDAEEDIEAKRRRVLAETRDIDADSDGSGSESSEEDRSVLLTEPMIGALGLDILVTMTKTRQQSCSGSWKRSSAKGLSNENKRWARQVENVDWAPIY